jgi:hypothetical protein
MRNQRLGKTPLYGLFALGFGMLICGGCFASMAEGFGGPAPPIGESIRTKWIGGSILIAGAALSIGSAIGLYITENRHGK